MSTLPDVVIVGAGVIGLATGRELAQRGLSVVIVERGSPGREATWAAAGMLSPLGEAAREPALFALADASLDLWPALADALHEDTGADVEYRACGALHIAFDGEEAERLGDLADRAGDVGRAVDPAEIRELHPALSSEIVSGLFIGRDHRVDNRRLGQALWSAAVGAGAEFRLGVEVAGVELANGAFRALVMTNGARLPAARCVIASGAWSGRLEGLPGALPVRPVRGQMFSVGTSRASPLLSMITVSSGCYLVPRDDGRVLVGATVEEVGFDAGPTASGLGGLFTAAGRILPTLLSQPVSETWAGFRPGTPDERPILGADPDASGLFYATGHYRNGILFAPVTARLVADVVTGRDVPALAEFSVARFRP